MPSTELTAVPWNHQTNINTINNNQSWSSGWSRANYSEQATTTTRLPSRTSARERRKNNIVALQNWCLIEWKWTINHRKQSIEERSLTGGRATGATWKERPSYHVSLLLLDHLRSICTTLHNNKHHGAGRSSSDFVDHFSTFYLQFQDYQEFLSFGYNAINWVIRYLMKILISLLERMLLMKQRSLHRQITWCV